MTSTERLRAMLDERGESYVENDFGITWRYYSDPHTATESMDGTLQVTGLTPEQAIAATLGPKVTGETSDGYHTFNELYHHRAVLFSVIVRDYNELAWKSKLHHDGAMYDGMFIVGIETPAGQATYHYDIDPYWEMFACKELERAPEWDGHTPEQAIARIATLGSEDSYTHRDVERAFVGGYCLGADMFNQSKEDKGWDERLREMDEEMAERGWVRKDATLGAGTCHDTGDLSDFCCSECGVRMFTDTNETYTMIASDGRTIIKRPNYCPNCGKRVVEVDE